MVFLIELNNVTTMTTTTVPNLCLLLIGWGVFFITVQCVTPGLLSPVPDPCPRFDVYLDGRKKEFFLWKCGEPLQVLLMLKNADAQRARDLWSVLHCLTGSGSEIEFQAINRTTRFLKLEEPCPGNVKKSFTCMFSEHSRGGEVGGFGSRSCSSLTLTQHFEIYFVYLPEPRLAFVDYEDLVASTLVAPFHLKNSFVSYLEWRSEEAKDESLCPFRSGHWRVPSPTPARSVLGAKSDDPGCFLRVEDPFRVLEYRVRLISRQPPGMTGLQEVSSAWQRASLVDLLVPNNASYVNVSAATSRSVSLEWPVDEMLTAWRVPIHYEVSVASLCIAMKEATSKNRFRIDDSLFPGQWYDITVTTIVNKTLVRGKPASLRLQTPSEVPEAPTILSEESSFSIDISPDRTKADIIFYWLPPPKCEQNGDISYELLYTIDDQSLPQPFVHNSRCPSDSKDRCTEHYVLTIMGDKMMPRIEDNQRVTLSIRSRTEAGTSFSSSEISATVSFDAFVLDRDLGNFKVSRSPSSASSSSSSSSSSSPASPAIVNVTWEEALLHPRSHPRRRFADDDCVAVVVVCADDAGDVDDFCTGESRVETAPARAGHLVMPLPRFQRRRPRNGYDDDDDDDDGFDDYKWGLAIKCPNASHTGIHWRMDDCVYRMGVPINPKTVYKVEGHPVNSTTIQLEWSALRCSDRGAGVDRFFVVLKSLGETSDERQNTVRNSRPYGKKHIHSVHNLTPSTTYLFAVRPYSVSTGEGTLSAAVEIPTDGDEKQILKYVVIVVAFLLIVLCCGFLLRKRQHSNRKLQESFKKDVRPTTTWYGYEEPLGVGCDSADELDEAETKLATSADEYAADSSAVDVAAGEEKKSAVAENTKYAPCPVNGGDEDPGEIGVAKVGQAEGGSKESGMSAGGEDGAVVTAYRGL